MREGKKELTLKDYNKLFKSLYPQLCVFAYKYLDNLETSKDIVQEVFIKVWEDKTVFQDENHTTGYFYKAVKNKCLNYLKSKRHQLTERYGQESMETHETEEFLMSEAVVLETTVIIENAIKTLPEKAAQVIRLSIKDYTNDEIAKALSISVNTVKDHKKVAYRKLRKILGFLRQVFGVLGFG
ncbi:ECF RNA polymerase sigma factor SigW [Mariniflexile rhizosphaerae]|uniref:RNA polymerase sigma-70 factor n=2 Tax=unclassified Mariniflexile TaxID=2643887 RepID=UPI000CB7839F|nr:RNA polymerase sigma-70 factor [Mariniflexile sp. TRM1-10]AXP80423.1 ECF RNA polymerase sigma factor SigW [Mariniflexile sp. TRM1-10]PLB20558.1 MAG: RNA polymerase ECF-type sigma factor [Flavobacteriaceae bacterium FS1-H7996/R]